MSTNEQVLFPQGTRIHLKDRCRPYYGEEYQGELTVRGWDKDDYGRRLYRFKGHEDPSDVYLLEFQIEHEFEKIL